MMVPVIMLAGFLGLAAVFLDATGHVPPDPQAARTPTTVRH